MLHNADASSSTTTAAAGRPEDPASWFEGILHRSAAATFHLNPIQYTDPPAPGLVWNSGQTQTQQDQATSDHGRAPNNASSSAPVVVSAKAMYLRQPARDDLEPGRKAIERHVASYAFQVGTESC